jgi:hypothetical protein
MVRKNVQVYVLPEEMEEAKACKMIVENFMKRVQQPKIKHDEVMLAIHYYILK